MMTFWLQFNFQPYDIVRIRESCSGQKAEVKPSSSPNELCFLATVSQCKLKCKLLYGIALGVVRKEKSKILL